MRWREPHVGSQLTVQLDAEKLETFNESQSKLMFLLDYLYYALRKKKFQNLRFFANGKISTWSSS